MVPFLIILFSLDKLFLYNFLGFILTLFLRSISFASKYLLPTYLYIVLSDLIIDSLFKTIEYIDLPFFIPSETILSNSSNSSLDILAPVLELTNRLVYSFWAILGS